jgi:hypothetical protein
MKPAAKAVQKETQIITKADVKVFDITLSQAPDYLAEYGGKQPEGFEEVRPGDVKVPRLQLAQALTPQLNEDDAKHIPGLKRGDFFNTLIGKSYGSNFQFIPLLKFGSRRLFKNMDEGGGTLCRSEDMKTGEGEPGGECAKCEFSQFGSARNGEGKGTACSEFYNFPVLVVEDGKIEAENFAIFAMKSSHIEAAQHLIGLTMRRKLPNGVRAPMWAGIYSATSKAKDFGKNLKAYVPVIDNAGWVAQEDVDLVRDSYRFFHELREQGRLKTEEEFLEPGASDAANA